MSLLISIPWTKYLRRVWNILTLDRKGRRKERTILLIGSLVFTLFVYHRAVEYFDPARHVLRLGQMEVAGESYRMYSGSAGGMYAAIAGEVEKGVRGHGDFEVERIEVGGSRRILDKILDDPNSFGIVQQDVLDEIHHRKIRVLAPLYNERVHAVYRWSKFVEASRGDVAGSEATCPQEPRISEEPDPATRRMFSESKVRLGSTRPSGGQLNLAQRLLKIAGLQPQKQEFRSIEETAQMLEDGELDMALITVGAPLSKLEDLLEDPDESGFCLMSVTPPFVRLVNDAYDTHYRPTGFSGIYDHRHDGVTTLGIPAMLVANRSMPQSAFGPIAGALAEYQAASNGDYHPFDDYAGTLERLEKEAPSRMAELIEAAALFLLFLGVVMTLLNVLATWVLSSTKGVFYFRRLNQIYRELPSHVRLDDGSAGLPVPSLETDDQEILQRIVRGISHLLAMAMSIRDDYETGGITASHHSHLIGSVYEIKAIFMRHLSQRLNRVLETKSVALAGEDLLSYYTAGYLFREDYRDLSALLGPTRASGPRRAAVPKPRPRAKAS